MAGQLAQTPPSMNVPRPGMWCAGKYVGAAEVASATSTAGRFRSYPDEGWCGVLKR